MHTRFVIFAAPRTGSNWLCSMLDSHPRILCHHEIFNPTKIIYAVSWHGREVGLSGVAERDADPLGFLRRLWSVEVAEEIVGIKLNRGQEPRAFEAVLADPDVRKVLLFRNNRIRTFVSETIATRTSQWESYPWSRFEPNSVRVGVEVDALRRHIELNNRYLDDLRSRVRASGQNLFELSYEDLSDPGEQNRLLCFLGAEATPEGLSGMTVRQNPAPLKELIVNFQQLERQLSGTDLQAELYG